MADFTKKGNLYLILTISIIIFIVLFLISISMALFPFLFGIILAYLFNPFIEYMEKRNFSREGAILLLIIIVFNFIFISGLFFVPILIRELNNLTEMIPEYISTVDKTYDELNERYKKVKLPPLLEESFNKFLKEAENYIINFIHRITEILLSSIPLMLSVILSPIITYYILRDIEDIKRYFLEIIPVKNKNLCKQIGQDINNILIGYLRGQIWISIIVGFLVGTGLLFWKVKFNVILGVLAGITNLIPYIGPIIGALPAILITFLSSPIKSLGVAFLYIFIQQFESLLIAPKIMSESIGLHPLVVIFALLSGAELLGVWGLLFAVPLAGIIKIFLKLFLKKQGIKDR